MLNELTPAFSKILSKIISHKNKKDICGAGRTISPRANILSFHFVLITELILSQREKLK